MKAYIVTVTFEELQPKIWRKLILPAGASFNRLHEMIQEVTNFQDEHTYAFELEGVYITNNEMILDEYKKKLFGGRVVKGPIRQKIDTYLEQSKQLMYTYDMGDCWRIRISLDKIVEDYYFGFPTLLEVEGIAPPENVGGADSYAEFLAIYNDRNNPAFLDMYHWAEAMQYGPTDSELVNYLFKSMKYQKTEWDKVDHDNYVILQDQYRPSDVADLDEVQANPQLLDYVKACVHLYGIIDYTELLEIYNAQNPGNVASNTLHWITTAYDNRQELLTLDIIHQDDCFFHASVNGKQAELISHGFGKPYYIPPKSKLLKYADPHYFEKTPQQNAFISRFAKDFHHGNTVQAEKQAQALFLQLKQYDLVFSAAVREFIEQFDFKNLVQVNDYIQLIQDVANTSRIWENRGHTAFELRAMSATQLRQPLESEPAQAAVKQGRNDPCECNSGKKYKKCCGKHA